MEWGFTQVSFGIDILSFPIALGVIVFSYTSQIFLPTLEGNMLDKSKFHCMLNWSHIAAAIFKALFGYVGFLTFKEGEIFFFFYEADFDDFVFNFWSILILIFPLFFNYRYIRRSRQQSSRRAKNYCKFDSGG